MSDPLMEMVDGVVASLITLPVCSGATIEWTDDALAELADENLLTTRIWVVDASERLPDAAESHGVAVEEFGVLLIVQRKFAAGDDKPTKTRELLGIVSAIVRHCRKTTIHDATCVRAVRESSRNLKDHNQNDRFYAEILTTWRRELDEDA